MLDTIKAIKRWTLSRPDAVNALRVNPSETIIINGFWRSGTTWLQELVANTINAKRIFEPLQARAGYIQQATKHLHLPDDNYTYINGFMPFVSGPGGFNPEIEKLVHLAQTGAMTSPFILRDQSLLDPQRAFNTRVVVKYVKGALFLHSLQALYRCPVIHIYRDPRSVIASIKSRPYWAEGAFENFSLIKHLLEVDDGRADYFSQFSDEICAIEKTNDIQRLAGYYFLTEKYVEDSFAHNPDAVIYVKFEELAKAPERIFTGIIDRLNITDINMPNFRKPSSTAYRTGQEMKIPRRSASWEGKIDAHHVTAIEDIARQFGMSGRLSVPSSQPVA